MARFVVVRKGIVAERTRFARLLCLLLFAGLLISNPCFANHSDEPGNDIVLLVDSSGSMKKTDPDELRKPAAKLLISLLGPNDHVSVVSFSDQGYPISFLTGTSAEETQEQLFAAVEKVSSRGIYTNLYGAIKTAKRVLDKGAGPNKQQSRKSPPAQRQTVILMSDGKMDLGDVERSRQYSDKLFSALLPELKAAGVQIETIAFTDQSDKALLADIAVKTGGNFYVTKSAEQLHQTFAAIFEQNSQPDMLPFDEGHFYVDESISEITIVGSKDSEDVILTITTPANETYSAGDKPKQYKWRKSPLFDLITIPNPAPGDWHLKASNNNNIAYIITDLALGVSVFPDKPVAGDVIEITAWLERAGDVLIKDAITSNLDLKVLVVTPDEETYVFPFSDLSSDEGAASVNGIFTGSLELPDSGKHVITVIADSGTFQRTKNIFVKVSEKPVEERQGGLGNQESVEEPLQEDVADKKDVRAQENVEPDESVDTNYFRVISVFIGINVFLVVIYGVVLFLKKRKTKSRIA